MFVAERLVEAALLYARGLHQIGHRRRLVPMEPEGIHRGLEGIVDLELSGASSGGHGVAFVSVRMDSMRGV